MKDSEDFRKQKFEKECNPPPISESLKKIRQNSIDRQEIQKWVKRDIKIGETISATPTIEECRNFPYLSPLISAFNAWSTRNMVHCLFGLKMFSHMNFLTKNGQANVESFLRVKI